MSELEIELERQFKLDTIRELLYDATKDDDVMIFVETEDYQYEIDDVEVKKTIDNNNCMQTVVHIKVKK